MVATAMLRQPLKSASVRSAIINWNFVSNERAPLALSFQEFCKRIPTALTEKKEMQIGGGSISDPVTRLFRQLDTVSACQDLAKYAHVDPSLRYTRNLVDTDDETYTLLLLCWNPGHESPIHDHPGDGCWVKCLDGVIRECRYRQLGSQTGSRLQRYQSTTAIKGVVMYMDDSRGFHKVGNPSNRIATTLHLYSPKIQTCRTWTSEHDTPKDVVLSNYSEFGSKL